jgi:hypothetical protein
LVTHVRWHTRPTTGRDKCACASAFLAAVRVFDLRFFSVRSVPTERCPNFLHDELSLREKPAVEHTSRRRAGSVAHNAQTLFLWIFLGCRTLRRLILEARIFVVQKLTQIKRMEYHTMEPSEVL